MGDYFKPWRRKIGVATLVLACVFMAGWVRSRSYWENIGFATGRNSVHGIISLDGHLIWLRTHEISTDKMPTFAQWGSSRFDIPNSNDFEKFEDIFSDSSNAIQRRWLGFATIENPTDHSLQWIAPYWSIVIPLTLLSAYLLLSKPRPSTSEKLRDPIPKTVT